MCSALALELGQRASSVDLPTPGGPVKPTHRGLPGVRIDLSHELPALRIVVLHERDRAGQGTLVAGKQALGEGLLGVGHEGEQSGARSQRACSRLRSPGRLQTMGSTDRLIGDGIEAAVRAKHRRRLRRLGQDHALRPSGTGGWAQARTPPRSGCELEVLIDGAAALPEMASAMRSARRYVHITGWHVAAAFEVERERGADRPRRAPGRARRDGRRAGPGVGRRARARLSSHPRRGPRGGRRTSSAARASGARPTRASIRSTATTRRRSSSTASSPSSAASISPTRPGDRFDSQAHHARRRLGWHDVGHATSRSGGGRRGRPLRAALAGADRRRGRAGEPAGAGRREDGPGRAHGRRGHVRPRPARRVQHPRELPAGAAARPSG